MSAPSEEVDMNATSEEDEMNEYSELPDEELIIQFKIGDSLPPSKVYKYFTEQFGDIFKASFIPGFAFIFLDLVETDPVMQVLREQRIEIEGQCIPVKRTNYWNLPYEMYKRLRSLISITPIEVNQLLLKPEDETSPRNILNALIDDCLIKILKQLSLIDLCNIAKTCCRLNEIAKEVFTLKYEKKTIFLSHLERDGETVTMMKYFLSNFGSSISSIDVSNTSEWISHNDIVRLLNRCKNIQSLSLDGKLMKNFVVDDYIEMFGRLKELVIRPGSIPLNRLLAACSHVEKLSIVSDDNSYWDLKDVSLPKLIALDLHLFNIIFGGIHEFLKRHRRIESFSLQLPFHINSDRHHYETNDLIYKYFPNIRHIELDRNSSDGHRLLSKLTNLKSVKLYYCKNPVTLLKELLARKTPIEEMDLCGINVDSDAIEAICQIKTIEKISFDCCTGFDFKKFIRLVEALSNLKEIITWSINEHVEFLDKILPILRNKGIKWLGDTGTDFSNIGSYDPKNDVVFLGISDISY